MDANIISISEETGATISACGNYRYRLWRIWNKEKPAVLFIMLNPSRADAHINDPTIRRCINFAKGWGYGGIYVGNLFAYRTANPLVLQAQKAPIGPENDQHLKEMMQLGAITVLAWGNHGKLFGRDQEIMRMVSDAYCLDISKAKQPKHPLYLRKDVQPKPFSFFESILHHT